MALSELDIARVEWLLEAALREDVGPGDLTSQALVAPGMLARGRFVAREPGVLAGGPLLAPLFARLLQLSISRKREYLADAGAAQLTRYPEGLARALEKMSTDKEVLEVANRATQHLYIVNPIKPFEDRAKNLFSTHPPLTERVSRLRAM